MDKDDLKKRIKEIVEITKMCPANLQEKCFEMLLGLELAGNKGAPNPPPTGGQSDFSNQGLSSVPLEVAKRIKTFCSQYQLSPDMVLKVYAVDESGNATIEATDLKSNKIAQQQRRLSLLIGVRHQFIEGAFDVPTEELREMCVTYSAYDAANFKTNIKKSAEIFAGKLGAVNKLSPIGKKEAADLIKDLAS